MKLFDWRWLAVSSLLWAIGAHAATRPQYGGTLRVMMRAAPSSLDPADGSQPDSFALRSLTDLIFDTLVTADDSGHTQPSLAVSWQTNGNQHWQLHMRRGVKFQDGTPLTAENVAASLRIANPAWKVTANTESVLIECETPDPEMLAELALPRNAIAKRNPDGTLSGTGPFRIADWNPGKKLILSAEEEYWRGRPFLDSIEIEFGRSFRDQMTAMELGRLDLAEVPAEQSHRISVGGRQMASSEPMELLALLFSRDAATPEEKLLRESLALSIERGSIRNVLLQGSGQATASILPNWMSGYGFVFSADADLARARHDREQARAVPSWTIGYDPNDAVERLVAERIALNAKDAGLSLQPMPAGSADVRVVRIPLASSDPWIALANVAALTGSSVSKNGTGSIEDLYAAEQGLLATRRLIPLFHLPVSYVAAPNLKDWTVRPDGTWRLENAWLGGARPENVRPEDSGR